MSDALVLNEASLPFRSLADCEKNIEFFFELVHQARLHNIQFITVNDANEKWQRLHYADGFSIGQWLDGIQNKDRQRQIKSVLSGVRCSFVNMSDNKQGIDTTNMLFQLTQDEDIEVVGLGFASLNDSHAVSFASEKCWMQSSITISKLWDQDGKVRRKNIDVPNIADLVCLTPFFEALKSVRTRNKQFFASLKIENNEEFPRLLFAVSALKSLKSSALQVIDFNRVIDVLYKLNEAIVESDNLAELVANSGLTITGESVSTMSNKALVRLRTFKHPVQSFQVFDLHVKNFSDHKRMHILVDYGLNQVCVGYFGRHIKTSTE